MEKAVVHDGEVRVEMTMTEQVDGRFATRAHVWQGDERIGIVATDGADMDDARAKALEAVHKFLEGRAFASRAQTVRETHWIPGDGKGQGPPFESG